MNKKDLKKDELIRCIENLKLYFDHANIDLSAFVRKHKVEKTNRFQAGLDYMFNNFKDE
jgi:hypothetical protein